MSVVPAWTIVVPTRDRPVTLRATVAHLRELITPPGGFEIIVVDDGGAADLGFLAHDQLVMAGAEACPAMRLHSQRGAGPAAARNAGARQARGRWLAFTDDDCRPDPDWLLRFADAHAAQPGTLLGGATVNALTDNLYAEASQQLVSWFYTCENQSAAGPRFFASNNLALTRDAFFEVGGFDPRYPLAAGEDRAFCAAWRAAGRLLVYVPSARVQHHHALDLTRFWRQHQRYGRGAYRFRKERAGQGKRPAEVGPGRLARTGALLAQPFRSPTPPGIVRKGCCSLLLAVSQVATAWGYARAWLEAGPRSPPPRGPIEHCRH